MSKSNVGPIKVNVISNSNSMATIFDDNFASVFTQIYDKTIPNILLENFKDELK